MPEPNGRSIALTITSDRIATSAGGTSVEKDAKRRWAGWASAIACVALGVSATLLTPFPLIAQQLPPGPAHPPSHDQQSNNAKALRAETELTLVGTTVTDPLGRLVTGLEQNNFRVFEDGVEQEIVRFSSEDVPVSIGV